MREGSPPPPVACHLSHVTRHMSRETYRVTDFFNIVMKLIRGGSVINGAYPVNLGYFGFLNEVTSDTTEHKHLHSKMKN